MLGLGAVGLIAALGLMSVLLFNLVYQLLMNE